MGFCAGLRPGTGFLAGRVAGFPDRRFRFVGAFFLAVFFLCGASDRAGAFFLPRPTLPFPAFPRAGDVAFLPALLELGLIQVVRWEGLRRGRGSRVATSWMLRREEDNGATVYAGVLAPASTCTRGCA